MPNIDILVGKRHGGIIFHFGLTGICNRFQFGVASVSKRLRQFSEQL